MEIGSFYFLKDEYFKAFPDKHLMRNKEKTNGVVHDRPAFYAFLDDKTNIYWMIPFSSRVDKFKTIYNQKVTRYGKCETIVFGKVLGHEKAFLIQNMCPITPRYINNKYVDSVSNCPVKVNGVLEKELVKKAKKILNLHKKGKLLIFPDVSFIEQALVDEMQKSQEQVAATVE